MSPACTMASTCAARNAASIRSSRWPWVSERMPIVRIVRPGGVGRRCALCVVLVWVGIHSRERRDQDRPSARSSVTTRSPPQQRNKTHECPSSPRVLRSITHHTHHQGELRASKFEKGCWKEFRFSFPVERCMCKLPTQGNYERKQQGIRTIEYIAKRLQGSHGHR